MDPRPAEVARFLESLLPRHHPILPQFGDRKILSFMATSASPGLPPSVSVHRLESIDRDERYGEPVVRLRGALPRPPGRGDLVAVAVADAAAFRGFQLKTHSLVDPAFAARLTGAADAGALIRTPNVFTIHHGPHAASFFEQVPLDEVTATAARARLALVAVGEAANISPRWIFHHELRAGALELFQGDAMWSKTYLNVRRNPRENRIVIDLETGEGWVLEGEIGEFAPDQHPVAAERILAAFQGAGLKPPTRLYRLRVDGARPIAPRLAAPAAA
jgi:hypothetical protein